MKPRNLRSIRKLARSVVSQPRDLRDHVSYWWAVHTLDLIGEITRLRSRLDESRRREKALLAQIRSQTVEPRACNHGYVYVHDGSKAIQIQTFKVNLPARFFDPKNEDPALRA
ncbi:hypothetical protein C6401_16680, partial [Arthrobacter woluwensis]|uniref:hypothetical protein n=1 Tax=Arthrobacter woluwensis TaxID=156980 RepID=UPI000D46CE77